ncbi:MAG: hypothetical protein JSW60_03810 [Thermoplasmatales archaeon]|nr:MAG: hypothetical protein JSW60_03810 [Thermoplasmatales archaeon]
MKDKNIKESLFHVNGKGFFVKAEDIQTFLDDFKKADVSKKLDMWYYALDQGALWEEILTEISALAQPQRLGKEIKKEE